MESKHRESILVSTVTEELVSGFTMNPHLLLYVL